MVTIRPLSWNGTTYQSLCGVGTMSNSKNFLQWLKQVSLEASESGQEQPSEESIPVACDPSYMHCPGCDAHRPEAVWGNLPLAWYYSHEDDKDCTPTCDVCRAYGVWAVGHTTNFEYPCGTDCEERVMILGPTWNIRINALPAGMALGQGQVTYPKWD